MIQHRIIKFKNIDEFEIFPFNKEMYWTYNKPIELLNMKISDETYTSNKNDTILYKTDYEANKHKYIIIDDKLYIKPAIQFIMKNHNTYYKYFIDNDSLQEYINNIGKTELIKVEL